MTKIQVNSNGKAYMTSGNKVLIGKDFGTKTVTTNGTYTASSDNLDGYSSVIVNTTELNGDTLSVTPSTSSQTLTPTSPKNGFTQVNVSAVTSSIDNNIIAENIKKDVTILGITGSYEGSGGGSGKYALLDRVKDDSNNEIGTVSGFFTDANNQEYAVVCLDAQYRLAEGAWSSSTGVVTNLPLYSNLVTSNVYAAKETATFNTQKILDWCSANSYTSDACSHCRNKSFAIDNITYYGQLPNLVELIDIAKNYNNIETLDTSASSNASLNFSTERNMWSSSQNANNAAWMKYTKASFQSLTKNWGYGFTCPVLEIPNS